MAVLPHLTAELEHVVLLTDGSDPNRSSKPYTEAYAAQSLPVKLPVPFEVQDDDPEAAIRLDETARSKIANKAGAQSGNGASDGEESCQPVKLPLFGSANARVRPSDAAPSTLSDVILSAGGPVWCIDWLPTRPDADGNEAATQYLAVAPHPKGKETTAIGKPVSGPCMLQIWQLQHRAAPGAPKAELPHMVLGICHDGGLVRDAKWCPAVDSSPAVQGSSNLNRLGVLAVLYGDGRLEILAVPEPASLASNIDPRLSNARSGTQMLVRLKPVLTTPPDSISSLGSCIEWLPIAPHDLLLMGCWDGTVALWKLPTAAGSPLQLLSHFLADSVPIRTIAWAPPHKDGTIDSHGRHCFLTAGHASSMKIWDVRDPFLPLLEEKVTASWILGTSWCEEPPGILMCQDDGALRWISFAPNERRKSEQRSQCCWWGVASGTLWSCDINSVSGHAAYAGDSGQVIVTVPGFQTRLRTRPPHHIISSTKEVNGVICMDGRQVARNTVGQRGPLQQGDVTDPTACITKVRWSAGNAAKSTTSWLASAAANGLVRCQRVSLFD